MEDRVSDEKVRYIGDAANRNWDTPYCICCGNVFSKCVCSDDWDEREF